MPAEAACMPYCQLLKALGNSPLSLAKNQSQCHRIKNIQAIIDDEHADPAEVGRFLDRILGARESLHDILVTEKRIERAANVGVILDNNDTLVLNVTRHLIEGTARRDGDKFFVACWVTRWPALVSGTLAFDDFREGDKTDTSCWLFTSSSEEGR